MALSADEVKGICDVMEPLNELLRKDFTVSVAPAAATTSAPATDAPVVPGVSPPAQTTTVTIPAATVQTLPLTRDLLTDPHHLIQLPYPAPYFDAASTRFRVESLPNGLDSLKVMGRLDLPALVHEVKALKVGISSLQQQLTDDSGLGKSPYRGEHSRSSSLLVYSTPGWGKVSTHSSRGSSFLSLRRAHLSLSFLCCMSGRATCWSH